MSSGNFSSGAVVVVAAAAADGDDGRVDRMSLFVCYPQWQSFCI